MIFLRKTDFILFNNKKVLKLIKNLINFFQKIRVILELIDYLHTTPFAMNNSVN